MTEQPNPQADTTAVDPATGLTMQQLIDLTPKQLERYMKALGQGTPPEQAAAVALADEAMLDRAMGRGRISKEGEKIMDEYRSITFGVILTANPLANGTPQPADNVIRQIAGASDENGLPPEQAAALNAAAENMGKALAISHEFLLRVIEAAENAGGRKAA